MDHDESLFRFASSWHAWEMNGSFLLVFSTTIMCRWSFLGGDDPGALVETESRPEVTKRMQPVMPSNVT